MDYLFAKKTMTEQKQPQKPAPTGFWDTYADNWNPMIVLEFRSLTPGLAIACIAAMFVQLALIVGVLITGGIHGFDDPGLLQILCFAYLYIGGMVAIFSGFMEGRIRFSIRRTYLYDWLGGDMIFRRGYGDPDEILEQNPLPDLQKFHARFIIGLVYSGIVSLCVLPLAVVFDIVVNHAPFATLVILGGIYWVQAMRLLFHSLFPINRTIGEYIALLITALIIFSIFVASVVLMGNIARPHPDPSVGFGLGVYGIIMSIATPIVAYLLIRHHLTMPRKRLRTIALMNGVAYVSITAVATLGGVIF